LYLPLLDYYRSEHPDIMYYCSLCFRNSYNNSPWNR